MVNRYVMKPEHDLLFDCLPYEWRSGTSDGLFLPIYPPRSMRVVLGFWWLVDFLNKYVSSLIMTNVESMDYTHSHPSTIASLSCAAQLSPVPYTHHMFLKKATIPTYYGIFHSHSEIYCHATFHRSIYYDTLQHCHITLHDHVVDIVFVAKPPFIILSYVSLLIHCTSRYTAGCIHIESYFVLSIEL